MKEISVGYTNKQRYMLKSKKYKTCEWKYIYQNRQSKTVKIWVSVPMEMTFQRNIRKVEQTPPHEIHQSIDHTQLYYSLAPGESVRLHYMIDLYQIQLDSDHPSILTSLRRFLPGQKGFVKTSREPLTIEEEQFYLRDTLLVPVNEETEQEAQHIVGEETDPVRQAYALFMYLIKNYRYHYPPKERGAHYMKKNKKGDCGEFSFLFASWCRSLRIPCRTLVGSFAHGKMQYHVWNEFFVKGIGWIPVDSSIAASVRPFEGRIQHILSGFKLNPTHYFGNLSGNYLAFSNDANVPLSPDYPDGEAPGAYETMAWGVKNFAYGFHSHEGTAPYMQPNYVRFSEFPDKQSVVDLLGSSRVRESIYRETFRYMQSGGFMMAAASFVLLLLYDWFELTVYVQPDVLRYVIYIGLFLAFASYIFRRESNWMLNTVFFVFLFIFLDVL